jgi:hypothetical protein
MREGLSTGFFAEIPGSGLSRPILSGPNEFALNNSFRLM